MISTSSRASVTWATASSGRYERVVMGKTDLDFETAVADIVRSIPEGQIASYGEVALDAGFPGAARAVGNLLRRTSGLPWWRVVTATGRLVPGSEAEQAQHLRAEGVTVTKGRVSMGSAT
jgi:methylated-DNA-protein-cysteine methyltransferase-like protein